ncbi:RAD52 family DNA repair protein [bacterium]|nr:RAD52 family DNA repair protein [bacterium]
MKNEVRSILETPFTETQIKQRKGLWGKTLDYIEGHSVINRLNDAFESD